MSFGSCVSHNTKLFSIHLSYSLPDNVRYAFDVCLYSYPDAVESGTVNSPCNIQSSCGSLENAMKTSLLKTNPDNQFDYCEADDSIIKSSSYKECLGCLETTSNQQYLANCVSYPLLWLLFDH